MADHAANTFPDPTRPKQFHGIHTPSLDIPVEEDVPAVFQDLSLTNEQFETREQGIKEYNEQVSVLDPLYTGLTPLSNIIVRCYHLETVQKSGIFIPTSIQVAVQTANGIGVVETQQSPWQFSTRAIIVAVPNHIHNLKAGDEVQLYAPAVAPAIKNVKTAEFHLPNGFTHYSSPGNEPPTSLEDQHFGYLLVDPNRSISCLLKKGPNHPQVESI